METIGLIIFVGLAVVVTWSWLNSSKRKCVKCGSRFTLRHRTTTGPDEHYNGAWHVYHHVKCFRCKAKTRHEEFTHRPADWLRSQFHNRVR